MDLEILSQEKLQNFIQESQTLHTGVEDQAGQAPLEKHAGRAAEKKEYSTQLQQGRHRQEDSLSSLQFGTTAQLGLSSQSGC